MNKLVKIINHHSKLNKLIKNYIKDIDEEKSIDLYINVENLSLSPEYNEAQFNLSTESILIKQDSKEFRLENDEVDENLISELDDIVFDELQKNKWEYFDARSRRKENNEELFNDLNKKIEESTSLEMLYFKIHKDKVKYPESMKDYILYTMLIENNEKVKDIAIVEDFIDNYFNIKYADLILKYPFLSQTYKDKFLKHSGISPVVLDEYYMQNDTLPDFSQVLKTNDQDQINSFYFKMWNNLNYDNKSEVVRQLLNYELTSSEILFDIYERFDLQFIYQYIFKHKNCPRTLIEHYIKDPFYVKTIIDNPFLDENLLNEICAQEIDDQHIETILEKLVSNPNLSENNKSNCKLKLALFKKLQDKNFVNSIETEEWFSLLKQDSFQNLKLTGSEKVLIIKRLNLNNEDLNTFCDSLISNIKNFSNKISENKVSKDNLERTGLIKTN